ncbi:hypothetical protein CYMTET_5379 [Cymbomonas tetramitiformis]|uniref:Uncharacterized protein n=1 Tax=Cymbomonas tetramitiformis TaxID=36881 RepID=A0AAE0LJ45_9CHLO|nr:hypothetical protein CYMTET_5379 [Cymbomonas tetramitiformis]
MFEKSKDAWIRSPKALFIFAILTPYSTVLCQSDLAGRKLLNAESRAAKQAAASRADSAHDIPPIAGAPPAANVPPGTLPVEGAPPGAQQFMKKPDAIALLEHGSAQLQEAKSKFSKENMHHLAVAMAGHANKAVSTASEHSWRVAGQAAAMGNGAVNKYGQKLYSAMAGGESAPAQASTSTAGGEKESRQSTLMRWMMKDNAKPHTAT